VRFPGVSDGKYYDWRRDRPIDLERDGCPLAEWRERGGECSFAVHESGFRVFVGAAALAGADEYREGDPYTVAEHKDSEFHARRIQCTLDLIASALGSEPPTSRILDVACGEGHITAAIQKRFPKAEVSGFDYSISAITRAHRQYDGIAFDVADAYQPPFAPSYFDVIVCNNIWEHVGDPLRLLGVLYAVVRPGGHLVISTPSRYRLGNALRVLLGKPIQFMSPAHVTEYTVGQVEEQLRYGGFDVVATESPPLSSIPGTPVQKFVRSIIAPLLRLGTRLLGSHHSWEATVFFLARKRDQGS